MIKDVTFEYDQACQNVFDNIKKYLLNLPVLSVHIVRKGKYYCTIKVTRRITGTRKREM